MLLSRWLNAFTSRLSVRGTKNRVGTRRSPGRGTSQATQTASWIVGPNGSGNSAEFSSAVERLEDRLVLTSLDFGDAPDSYGTLLASNGARHETGGASLGAKVDLEDDGLPNASATGDDINVGVLGGAAVATYATSTPAYNFVNISGTGTSVSLSDDSFSSSISLPFNFDFFGSTKSALFIASDGYLSFSGDDSSYSSTSIPDVGTPNDFIAGLWVDLDPSEGGTVTYQTMGSVGSRVFIAQFTNIQHYNDGDGGFPVTFQFKLFETTNNIEVHYQLALTDGNTRVAGVENSDGTVGVEFFEGTGAISSNSAVLYSPTLAGAASVGDDEDGITFLSDLLISDNGSTTASVDVDLQNADSLGSHLDAWLDLNRDGDFNDANEKVINNVNLGSTDGLKRVSFTIAQDFGPNVVEGLTFMRFRLSSTGGLAATGYAADGEVEDYQVDLQLAGGEGQVLDLPTGGGG
ncbi:MAG: GEVED domain-containing protein [Planctomycetia bacterium]|nr:GEVED domain-containing protein [Planctomycetia bacterium]